MLTPAWYLPDTDWFAQLPDAPRPCDADQPVIGQLTQLLGGKGSFDPAVTVAATHVLLAVEHLGDTMTLAAASHPVAEVARLLCGIHLAQTHLTQLLQRIATNIAARTYPGTADAPATVVRAIADSLGTAGATGELLAGHLNEVHPLLRGIVEETTARPEDS